MSKISENLIKQIQDEINRRGGISGSLDELNKIAGEVSLKYNQSPHPDFEGLSPHQMHILLDKQFSAESIVKFNTEADADILASSPFIRICLIITDAIKTENGLKLTTGGNLPRKIVKEIFNVPVYTEKNIIYPYRKKALNELDYLPAAFAHPLLKLSGVIVKRNNKLLLTREGKKIAENPLMLFQNVFKAFARNFNKGYLDGFESDTIGNLGTLYIVYLLNRYGSERREASFYSQLYFKAFPDLRSEITHVSFSNPEKLAYDCFVYRMFNKGFLLFGLVEIEYEGTDYINRKMFIQTTKLFHQVFKISLTL